MFWVGIHRNLSGSSEKDFMECDHFSSRTLPSSVIGTIKSARSGSIAFSYKEVPNQQGGLRGFGLFVREQTQNNNPKLKRGKDERGSWIEQQSVGTGCQIAKGKTTVNTGAQGTFRES